MGELRDFRDFSRCWAPIKHVGAIQKRASGDRSRRCSRPGYIKLEGHMYCKSHYRQWKIHYRILERIRSL